MIQLVYLSSATRDFTQQELLDLLEQSRERNLKMHITGMLLYNNGSFIQILEGEENDVLDIYDSILKDDRNSGNYIVDKRTINTRNFPRWSMGFKDLSGINDEDLPAFSNFLNEEMSPQDIAKKSDSIVKLLFSFKTLP